jgi:hypothetical protein
MSHEKLCHEKLCPVHRGSIAMSGRVPQIPILEPSRLRTNVLL